MFNHNLGLHENANQKQARLGSAGKLEERDGGEEERERKEMNGEVCDDVKRKRGEETSLGNR